jgi:hypothetical protein
VLEYMAAEKLSVSTPITDVKVPYGDVVAIASTADEYIAACEQMLAKSPEETAALVERMREIVANTSWDKTAGRMHELISTTAPGAARSAAAAVLEGGTAARVNPLPEAQKSAA